MLNTDKSLVLKQNRPQWPGDDASAIPHTLYRSVPQIDVNQAVPIVVLSVVLLMLVQWLAGQASISILYPYASPFLKQFSWGFGYVGHLPEAAVALSLILVLRPWYPSSFGLSWPRGWSHVRSALIWGSLSGLLMLVVDYAPALLAHHAPPGPYGLAASNVLPWLFMQGVLVGPTEEVIFRGLLLSFCLCLYPPRVKLLGQEVSLAGIVIAVVFSLAHADAFWQTTLFAAFGQQAYAITLGIYYAWLFEKSGSLIAPALAHNMGDFIEWGACFALRGLWGHH